MAVLTTPCPALLHTPTQAFPTRLALDDPGPLACFGPRVGQSEQVTWTRAPCRPVAAWRPLEHHQRRFLRMNGEAETGEAFRQDGHNPAGIGFALAADDKIIGKARQNTVARPPGDNVLDQPCVQDLMQAYLGSHGRQYTSYKVANMLVEFSTSIPRTQLRPSYGDGFLGAPLQMGQPLENPTPREQGEQRGSSSTQTQQTPGSAPHV
jgi:hypothetical protein